MATDTSALPAPRRGMNPEWALAILAVLTFALIPIQINTIYSGLPAHPLFLHVPVMLIPVAAIAAVVLAIWPRLFARHGIWVGLVAVVALGATNLTIGAGEQLRTDLHLEGPGLIERHAHAADILRLLVIAFTALLLVAVAAFRTPGPRVTGVGAVDGGLHAVRSRAWLGATLRAIVVVLALASLYFVFHVGDLGAKAVWQGRVGGGRGGFAFPGGAGGRGGFPGVAVVAAVAAVAPGVPRSAGDPAGDPAANAPAPSPRRRRQRQLRKGVRGPERREWSILLRMSVNRRFHAAGNPFKAAVSAGAATAAGG